MGEQAKDIWAELENPPTEFEAIADLYHWSTNYQAGEGPFTLFLDLTGWSGAHLGENVYQYRADYAANLGYVELDKLGRALIAYADHGSSASAYVERLIELESQD